VAIMTVRPGVPWRVEFDAEVEFSNGGALQAQGFRLDLPAAAISEADLGELFVRHLGLLMVGSVRITRMTLIQEPHKGSRGVPAASGPRRVVELTGCAGTRPAPTSTAPVPATTPTAEPAPMARAKLAASPLPPLAAMVDLPATLLRTLGSSPPRSTPWRSRPMTSRGPLWYCTRGAGPGWARRPPPDWSNAASRWSRPTPGRPTPTTAPATPPATGSEGARWVPAQVYAVVGGI
jgi:hypothetical protein